MKISILKEKFTSLKQGVATNVKPTDYKKVATKTAITLFRFAMLIAVGYTVVSPLFQIISNSLKSDADFMNTSVAWIPTTPFSKTIKTHFL